MELDAQIRQLERALRERPDDPQVRGRLGLLYNRLGKTFRGRTISDWIARLEHHDQDEVRAALDQLKAIGPPALLALPAIKLQLDHQKLDIRLAAAETYAALATDAGELEDALGGHSHRARAAVIAALRALGLKSRRLLAWALEDPAYKLRASAAEALGFLADPAALPELRQALRDPEPQVRFTAAYAIAAIQSPEAAAILTDALEHESAGDPAARAIRSAPALPLPPGFADRFHDPKPELRRRLVIALSHRSFISAILPRALIDPSPGVRRAARRIQTPINPGRTSHIRSELQNPDPTNRLNILRWIDDQHAELIEDLLIERLRDVRDDIRRAAAKSLAKLQVGAALPELRRLLLTTDEETRRAAAQAIAAIEIAIAPTALEPAP